MRFTSDAKYENRKFFNGIFINLDISEYVESGQGWNTIRSLFLWFENAMRFNWQWYYYDTSEVHFSNTDTVTFVRNIIRALRCYVSEIFRFCDSVITFSFPLLFCFHFSPFRFYYFSVSVSCFFIFIDELKVRQSSVSQCSFKFKI